MSIHWAPRHKILKAGMEPLLSMLDEQGIPFIAVEMEYDAPSVYLPKSYMYANPTWNVHGFKGGFTNDRGKYVREPKSVSVFRDKLRDAFAKGKGHVHQWHTYNDAAYRYWREFAVESRREERSRKQAKRLERHAFERERKQWVRNREDAEAALKKTKFKRKNVTVSLDDGSTMEEKMLVLGPLAVRTIEGYTGKRYRLTHVSTGFAMWPESVETQRHAKIAALRLVEKYGDALKGGKEIVKIPDLRKDLLALMKDPYGTFS